MNRIQQLAEQLHSVEEIERFLTDAAATADQSRIADAHRVADLAHRYLIIGQLTAEAQAMGRYDEPHPHEDRGAKTER